MESVSELETLLHDINARQLPAVKETGSTYNGFLDRIKAFLCDVDKAVALTNEKYSIQTPAASEEHRQTDQQQQLVKVTS